MGDRELRDELLTLLLAGHETTATSLSWALERLLRHPAAWDRIRDEAATGETAYIDATVKETLRLRPVLPLVVRELQRPLEIAGHHLPAGVRVAPCIYLMHRRPELYPEPSAFRPERFLDGAPEPYSWIPFGGGVRRCLGAAFAMLEMRIVISTILSRATLRASRAADEKARFRGATLLPSRGGGALVEGVSPRVPAVTAANHGAGCGSPPLGE